ncbi:MAG: signal peptidase I [Simkania negevensis]|nr:signal peptidase I [Simkania negevensis]
MTSPFSIKKSKKLFFVVYRLFKKKKRRLSLKESEEIKGCLDKWQEALVQKNLEKGAEYTKKGASFLQKELKKTLFDHLRDTFFALVFALLFATIIRSLWFELYEIPSGSMRPTFKEQDRLVVTKTAFGLNFPLRAKHLLFDPDLLKRGGTLIFTGANMDIADVNTLYFYLFPGKKQYVKRLIGKPGDTLYFYGGKIYGIDQNGKEISEELNSLLLEKIDHVPYIYFDGRLELSAKTEEGLYKNVIIKQMNQPVVQLTLERGRHVQGKLLPPYQEIEDYFDLWGFKHYGKVRLLSREELLSSSLLSSQALPLAPLYLEIAHHPSITSTLLERDLMGRLRPALGLSYSLLPLQEKEIKILFKNLYTARFKVENGIARRIGNPSPVQFSPKLKGVPDGTYEFYHGKAEEVLFSGITKSLPENHPLYSFSIEKTALLFNLGIEWNTFYQPQNGYKNLFPSRYAYYRKGDLYVMGTKFLEKEDPALITFLKEEAFKAKTATSYHPYFPFEDNGSLFTKEGALDFSFLQKYGIKVPEKHYLVLGDNYAMSADSRDFGFVPEDNIRGAPDFIFYPPGSRFGKPLQSPYPLFNLPRVIIWVLAGTVFLSSLAYQKRKTRLPLKI